MGEPPVDVLIVGSGPAGATYARAIGDAAPHARVLMVEVGPVVPGSRGDHTQNMTDEERAEMIAGMVQGLRDRLTTQGGSGAEWARLVAALSVQGDDEGAREMLARGRGALAGDADGLAALDEAAARAGLE